MYSTVPFLTHLHGDASARCLRLRAIVTPKASFMNRDLSALKAGFRRGGCGAILNWSGRNACVYFSSTWR